MKLYHGSNISIARIDLNRSKPYKDFGKGFYLTTIREQALRMAEQTVRKFGGTPFVNEYEFDETFLHNGQMNVKVFNSYSEEWAHFIVANRDRNNKEKSHDFDIVVGSIADERVGIQLFRYLRNFIDMPTLIKELKYKELTIQYYFGTERAVKLLKKL